MGSIRQRTANEAIGDIKISEQAGARAFILHIQLLNETERTFDGFKAIADSTDYPVMAIFYEYSNNITIDKRIAVQTEAISAGFRSADLPMNSFDGNSLKSLEHCTLPFAAANPSEVSMNADAIERQMKQIKAWQDLGAEVLMSAHVGVELSEEQTLSIAKEIQSRGADIVKIVAGCKSKEQAAVILQTNLRLKKELERPFLYTCFGKYGSFIRPSAPLFGSMLAFGHGEYGELSNREKPLLSDLKKVYEKINWGDDR